jgi:uncharacterized membrane protein YphA (DoxX/SURF4 family)
VDHSSGHAVAQLLAATFLAIHFLQSGLDKVLDWKGHRARLVARFAHPGLRRASPLLLLVGTALEVLAGVLSAAGALNLAVSGSSLLAFGGAVVAGVVLCARFLGTRLAKDDAAAASLVPYVLSAVGAVLLLGP